MTKNNKRKKVLFVTNDSVTYGSSKSMLNLIDELKKYQLDIKVLIPKTGPLEEELKKRSILYKKSRYFTWVNDINDKPSNLKIFLKKILNKIKAVIISSWVKKEHFDIIHSVNSAVYMGALLAEQTKKKHVWHIRELMEEDHNLEFFDKEYAYSLMNNADKLICISKSVMSKYQKYLDNNKLELVYNGLPFNEYKNEQIRNTNDFKILIAGNISKTKGQEEAIKAIEILVNKNIKNVKLLIAGNGPYEQELKEFVKNKNLDKYVEFLGFVNNLNQIRKDTNIALVCSRNEAFGRVTIESMMSKNLVIGANTGGTLELVSDQKNGFLYEQGNFEDLSQKIEYCINNWDECKNIIEYAYKFSVENFSIEKCAKNVYNVYKKIN